MLSISHPFSDEPLDEVLLTEAPLVKVLAQLRFPSIASVKDLGALAPFQKSIHAAYPVMREENQIAALVNDAQVLQTQGVTVRRFHTLESDWSLSLAPDWIALDTTNYATRQDFLDRWAVALNALAELEPSPAIYDRLGVRYVDRLIGDEATGELKQLVREEVLGALVLDEGMMLDSELLGVFTQANFRLEGLELVARWGRVPAGVQVIGGLLEPIGEPSWLLDIDVYTDTAGTAFDVAAILNTSERAARHAYRFFRWAMTEEFLQRHGGKS